ncbi:MAG: cbb3-type cytochrome oxidase assembly protein [Verrucomicrobiales bacterium]|jgi:nitrogen fixation-related uncharacterized protein|nr:cbb3-type cytochrome oxidase assembly protein [Verrucomicrobiales bacterium]
MSEMFIFYLLIVGSMVVLGGSAMYGIYWAVRDGQYVNMKKGAEVIFGKDEPVGKVTDLFPGMKPEDIKQPGAAKKR